MFDIFRQPRPFPCEKDEMAFGRRFVLSGLRMSRVAALIGCVLSFSFWLFIFLVTNEGILGGLQWIRLLMSVSLFFCAMLLFFGRRFAIDNYRLIVGVSASVVCILVGIMSLLPSGSGPQGAAKLVTALVLTCWLFYGFARLPARFVFLICSISLIMMASGAIYYSDGYVVAIFLYLSASHFVGFAMSTEIERREREIFSARKRLFDMARNLREAVREGERADAVKSHVLAAIGHDLRQPLTSMALYLETLKSASENQSGDRAVAVGGIGSCLRVMEGSIERIADVVSIRQSEESFPLEPVDMRSIFFRVESVFGSQARKAGVRLSLALPDAGSLVAFTNEERLWDVLSNLVSNALKYSSAREKPWVVVRAVSFRGSIRITVMDNGLGIPEEFHCRIFDEYFQLNNSARDREKGYGLGLSIVRETLARLPGHEVRLRSGVGRGCRFDIFVVRGESGPSPSPLPVVGEGAPAFPEGEHACLVGCYALIVEDDPLVRGALVETMQGWGMLVESATSLADTLELVRRTDRLFDVVISDLGLPGEADGVGVIEALRMEQALQTPAIILSGQLGSADAGRLERADVVVISKPVEPDRLRSCLIAAVRSAA